MRGKCSSKGKSMEVMESLSSKPEEEPHLSGAYIRSLVRHLSSSRPKGRTTNPKSPDSTLESLPPPPPPPRQPKKQVRRRLHTCRPYQERLLNMAEARREIVTALKFHRASMKQANVEHHHQPPRSPNPTPSICLQSWSYPTLAPLPDTSDNLNFLLPNKPLGLNLNFHGFNNICTPPCDSNNDKVPPVQPLLPPHYSSSSAHSYSGVKMHVAMDEKEMEEIRSIGEMHDIEWSDTMNLITSAWWSKLIETLEVDSVEGNGIPPWLQDGSGGEGNGSHL